MDNVIMVQDTMHSSRERKERGMLIKIDTSNAFDRVRLAFLFKVMEKFGFDKICINAISYYVSGP